MVTTCDDQVNILRHLLYNVLNIDRNSANHAVIVCFDGNDLKTIADFKALDEADIDQLTYNKLNTTTNKDKCLLLPVGYRANLRHLQKYVKLITDQYHESHNTYPPISHWQTLTWDMFQVYKSKPPPLPAQPTKATTTSTAITSADFKKSIKRDIALRPELKDILHFNTWKIQFEALIAKDQLGHVIDATYTSLTGTDEAITF